MQITEKLRSEIALALQDLGREEVDRIADKCQCSIDTCIAYGGAYNCAKKAACW